MDKHMYRTYKTEAQKASTFSPTKFEADAHLMLRSGEEISYHTVSEDNVFYDDEGNAVASIYSYSYFRTDVVNVEKRPVLFGFNGGPGSSSMYVHAGFMGTKRLFYGDVDRATSLPPYETIDNPDCLLEVADLVLVDPVGCGYGVLLDSGKKEDFYGIEQDAEALLQFIELWLHRYNRMNSPKYLIGESYGCTRSAVAAGIAATNGHARTYGFAFDGIVFIGNTVTMGKYFGKDMPVEMSVISFPTFAAINWYHNHPSQQSLEEFVYEAKHFADRDYLLALHRGEALTNQERRGTIEKIGYYTGMTADYLEKHALKIDDQSFRLEVIKEASKSVSRYDGRVTRPQLVPGRVEETVGIRDDASDDRWKAAFYGAVNGTILPLLNVKLERQYLKSNKLPDGWDPSEVKGTTSEQLRNAMTRTLGMRVFFANGWFDGATVTGHIFYLLDHAGLPKDRICFKGYASGHMIYLGEENARALSEDIKEFVLGGMPGKTFA